jgi:serine/threonine protein kinase/tetratricopeptide (TPR) repeat protein
MLVVGHANGWSSPDPAQPAVTPAESESSLIARLLALPVTERATFVLRACSEDPTLRDRVRNIAEALADYDPAKPSSPAPSSDGERIRALELALAPAKDSTTVIGAYKLLQKIGEGGFGIVWMAEQQQPVRRRVAIKIIKGGMETREVIARFEAERQALAMMDHPNIARVFDAGETDDGRPFVVMELVRGVPITSYCDEQRLSPEARLQLFVTVCQAVQHAHQKGIIHRDLKPSNIIVSLHDGVPVPKIIDFGIAKATEGRLTDKTLFTRFHAFIGTPAYTSPEQMEMGGLDVDTRSDIYSLGVLLYELLTGRPPFDPEELKKSSFEEMRRIVREVDPPRPSHYVGTMIAERRGTVAQQRNIQAHRLSLHLRGELDWIVLRCLEKDRTRRYATAQDLGADVQRHLRDEPVLARPPSAAYRVSKIVRRHRFAFAAVAAVMLALVGGLVMASVSLARERAAAAKSAQVARFMNDMLNSAGPSVALGRDPSLLREIADSTARRLTTELRDQPDVAADLRDTLGAIYVALGQMAKAEELLREAVEMHRAISGRESAETANSLHLLSTALRLLNKPEAEAAGQEALAIRRKLFGEIHPLVADTLYELAHVHSPHRTTAKMRAMFEQVLAIRRRVFGEEHPAVAQAIAGLGSAAQLELNHAEGGRLHAEALAMRRRLLGDDHPEVAGSLAALGACYAPELDQRREALAAYGEAFALRRKLLGDQHPKVLIPFLGMVGQLSAHTASPEQITAVREFVASQRRTLPRDSVLLAPLLLALASLELDAVNDSGTGAALEHEARVLLDASRGRGAVFDPEIIGAMMIFAWSKLVGNVPGEGVVMAEEAVKLARAAPGTNELGSMLPTHALAWINLSQGRKEAAVTHFEEAVRLFLIYRGDRHAVTLMNQAALAECYRATHRIADARKLLEAALVAQRDTSALPDRNAYIGFITAELGITLNCENRHAEAEVMLRQALLDYERLGIRPLGRRLRPPQRALSGLGLALAGQRRFAEAEPLVLRAFEELQANEARLAGDRAGMVREALDAVITFYTAWGRPEKVAEWKTRSR